MHHRLLVARLVVRQARAAFLERLPHAADVAVAEDAEHRRDQAADLPVALAVLRLEILHHRLRHRQADVSGPGEAFMGDDLLLVMQTSGRRFIRDPPEQVASRQDVGT